MWLTRNISSKKGLIAALLIFRDPMNTYVQYCFNFTSHSANANDRLFMFYFRHQIIEQNTR